MANLPDPFCASCGHQLTGLVDSSKCPECGRPLVEVLVRGGAGRWGKRYRSSVTLFGLPLIDVAAGPTPQERYGHAKGIFAYGDRAIGLVAVGGRAIGLVAVGGVAIGGISLGGVALGVIAGWGGLATGLIAAGGLAIGGLAYGGMSGGAVAVGGLCAGYFAAGGMPIGPFTAGPAGTAPEAADAIRRFSWFFGPAGGFTFWSMVQPMLSVMGSALLTSGAVAILAIIARMRAERRA